MNRHKIWKNIKIYFVKAQKNQEGIVEGKNCANSKKFGSKRQKSQQWIVGGETCLWMFCKSWQKIPSKTAKSRPINSRGVDRHENLKKHKNLFCKSAKKSRKNSRGQKFCANSKKLWLKTPKSWTSNSRGWRAFVNIL